jgi:hypothetical protein
VLTGEIRPGMVDQVIELAGCREKRRRLLPDKELASASQRLTDASV